MEAAEAGNRFAVAVDDLGSGLWSGRVKQELEARTPLRNVLISPSPSRPPVSVEELPIRFLDARSDPQLARLRQLAHSPAAWFRAPFVHVLLLSCPDYEEYKRDLRLRLKAMADTEAAAGQPELLFVYVRPAGAEAGAKGPARVFEAMRKELNKARRERCVRLDPLPSAQPGAPALLGLEEWERQARDALRAAFEARAAAYAEEVRRLLGTRLDPAWSFSALFLVKDGLAAMLEAAGLLEDALKECAELEACYHEVARAGQQPRRAFGGPAAGEDEAALLWAPWAAVRQAASQPELPPEFFMRQALFASQARLLLKLHRPAEVAERGLSFVRAFGGLLAQRQQAGGVPPLLREAWSFAACLSLAEATLRLQAARAEERRRADHAGRAAGRRGRLSEAAPGTPGSVGSPLRTSWDRDSGSSPLAGAGHPRLQVKTGLTGEAEGASSPLWPSGGPPAGMDWQLGALPRPAVTVAAAGSEGGAAARASPGGGAAAAPGGAGLYRLLAQLYCTARAELLRLGAALGLEVPKCAAGTLRGREPRHLAAAAEAAAPVEAAAPPPEPPAAARPASPLAESVDGLLEVPSTADMAQVPLDGTGSGAGASEAPPAAGSPPRAAQDAAAVTLESAPAEAQAEPGEGDAQRGSPGQAGGQPQRLSMRASAAGDSPSSSPRSTSTHQSSLASAASEATRAVQPLAAGAAAAGAAAAAAVAGAAASPLLSARSEQNDVRSVERQVASPLAARTGRASGGPAAAAAGKPPPSPRSAAGLPPWLAHWRLRAALSSQRLFTELFVQLSEAAARCCSLCGHARGAALLRADVADALAKQGGPQQAAELYRAQCDVLLREGWHALAAAVLPKLAACQLAYGSPGLAHTAAALLSLPAPNQGTLAQREAACNLLLQAAQAAEGPAAGRSPLLPASPAAAGLPPDAAVALSAAITAAPPQASVSRFFGRTAPGGPPLLAPPSGGPAGGALAAAVGDALAVRLAVHSQLPTGLPLSQVVLTLAVLQEMTVIHSPRAAPSPVAVLGSAPRLARAGTPATPLGDSLPALDAQDSGTEERYESRWQQVDELHCQLVAVSGGDGDGDGDGDGRAPRLQPMSGEAVLPPGPCLLTFLAAPVKRGLYRALHLRARLHQLPVHVAVTAPEALRQPHGAGSGGGGPLAPEPRGGSPAAEAIVMQVQQARPRVQLTLVAAGGGLVAGQEQWVGLGLAPARDALHGAQLELTWPLAHAGSGGLGLGPLSRKTTALAPRHRAVQSHGGDARLGGGGASAAISATLASLPFIRPEHRAAVLARHSPAGGEAPPPELLPADGPVGPSAAWLMAEGLQQHLSLPLVEAGRPVTLWWRVMAGEVASAPEQVHIAPPAPRHSARQHDARRAGLPADPGLAPAALLELPAALEYASGCQRSHSRVLGAPVRQPFAVACAARELPGGAVALQATLTSCMAVPAVVARLALEPQPGFSVTSSLLDAMGALPASLAPGGTLVASFLLAPQPAAASPGGDYGLLPAKMQPSALAVEYSVDSRQQCGVPATPVSAGGPAGGEARGRLGSAAGSSPRAGGAPAAAAAQHTPSLAVLELLDSSGRQRPGSPPGSPGKHGQAASPTAAVEADDEGSGLERGDGSPPCQQCTFRHLLTLEMPASEDDASGALVYVRQLGPFVATVGQPTTLCWRLERGGAADPHQPAARLAFEVQAEGDHWRPLGRRHGGVSLAGHDGAVATVEATWVPLAAGTLPLPTLRLQDVNFQEVYDVGLSLSGTSAITVVDAY